jgi:hypothetical protein
MAVQARGLQALLLHEGEREAAKISAHDAATRECCRASQERAREQEPLLPYKETNAIVVTMAICYDTYMAQSVMTCYGGERL